MQTHLGKLSIATVTILCSILFHIAGASQHFGAFPLLGPRDDTCSDGSDCLSGTSGLVCCPGNSPGTDGCMYAGSVCCGYGAYCATGQFCSPPNNGVVNCCFDSACETVVYSGGVPVVPYTEASLFTASPTEAATTAATGSPQTTGKSTPTTKASGSATNGSPAATKTSAGEKMVQVDLMAGLLVPLFAMAWTLLGAQL